MAENNDAAMNIDLSAGSDKWKCLLDSDGEPIRIDANNGGIKFTTDDETEEDYDGCRWKDVEFDCEITDEMKALGLFAGEPDAYIYADTSGERLPICGGDWYDGSNAGVFGVRLSDPRSDSYGYIGFRSAYYCDADCEECENADFDEVIAIVDKEWLLKKIGGDNPIQFLKEEYTSDDSVEWYYDAIREKKLAMVAFV